MSDEFTSNRYAVRSSRKRHKILRRRLKIIGAMLLAVGLIIIGVLIWWQRQINPPGSPGDEVVLTLPLGASSSEAASILEKNKVVQSATSFRLYLKVTGGASFKAGQYSLRQRQSYGDVVKVLEGKLTAARRRLTIPEGFTLNQIATRAGKLTGLSSEQFRKLASSESLKSPYQPSDSNNLEGLLFPDTYFIDRTDDERAVLEKMIAIFNDVAAEVELAQAESKVGLSPYEAVIVASLIEREVRRSQDQGLVARVIYNRLEKGMALQIDATLLYARGEHKNRVVESDKDIESPYNTYKNVGLPPTPIASPGKSALRAALNPPESNFLYYVTINDCTGETAFSRTYSEHQKNIVRRRKENC